MAKLICVAGMNKDDEFPIAEGTTTIGRAADCNITLFDKKCSRKHCQIFKKGNYCAVEDLDSRHGTLVDGKPVTKRQSLRFGDKIKLGHTTLILSDKALGDIVDQTADDAAADLQGKGFDQLMDGAAAEVIRAHQKHQARQKPGLFKKLFGRK